MKKLFILAASCAALTLNSCNKKQCWTFVTKVTQETWCGKQFSRNETTSKSQQCDITKAEAHEIEKQIEASMNYTATSNGCTVKQKCDVFVQ